MRPLTLELDGYGSFSAPVVVDFTRIRVAAIVGPNGAGKSTLLDAMMWALYGITRASDADSVVSTERDSATVTLRFAVDDAEYRVTRTRVRNKRTAVTVEASTDDGWIALSDGGVRSGDEAVTTLLGISAHALLSTTVLAQGDASRFAAATPSERKELLGEILGLDGYQVLADRAKRKLVTIDAQLAVHDTNRQSLIASITAAGDPDGDLAACDIDIAARRIEVDAAAAQVGSIQHELGVAVSTRDRQSTLQQQLDAAEQAHLTAAAAAAARVTKLTADDALLDTQLSNATQDVNAAVSAADHVSASTDAMESDIARLDGLTADRIATVEQGQQARADLDAAETRQAWANEQLEVIDSRLAGLGHADDSCFTCGQHLDADTAAGLVSGLHAQFDTMAATCRTAGDVAEAAATTRQALRDRLAGLDADIAVISAAIDAHRQQIATHRHHIEDSPRRHEVMAAITDAKAAMAADIAQARADVEAMTAVPAGISNLRDQLAAAVEAGNTFTQLTDTHQQLTDTHRQLTDALSALEAARGQLVAQSTQLAKLHADVDGLSGTISDLIQTRRVVELCHGAFSRDGIPAMILSSMTHEIETDTNDVLAQLSSSPMTVELRTKRLSKTAGTTSETLDITVYADGEARAYMSYSGSERLRVDLALRVALARVLARRSGHPVRLLAIDEGWGALDPDGVAALVGALTALATGDEFATILTVTHLPEVADAFAARLLVERDALGSSTVRVMT